MNYKFLIVLILSLKIEAHQPEKVVLLLDQIHESQAYWEAMSQDKKLNFLKRPLNIWLTNTRKADITCHQKNLAKQCTELIEALAALSENKKALSYETFLKLKKRTALTLTNHGAPSHFKRRWASYAGLCGGAAAIALYLHHCQNVQHYGMDSLKNMYTIFKNEPESKIFTTNIKDNEQLYEDTLTKVLVNAVTINQTAPLMHQSLNGKAIQELTFPEKQSIFLKLTASIGDIFNTQIKDASNLLNAENKKLLASKKESFLFVPIADNPYLPEWLRKQIIELNLLKESANENKELIKNLGGEAQKYANVIDHITKTTPGILGLTAQIITTTAFELKLKEASFTHRAEKAIQNAKLTSALALSTYLGYLGFSHLYKYTTALTLITPLKTDLISLQLVLNKERYTKDCTAFPQDFKGECFYWIQRLHRYKDKLPTSYRATYCRYLDDLENKTLAPEQKMTIITCLFHELDPLFKKD